MRRPDRHTAGRLPLNSRTLVLAALAVTLVSVAIAGFATELPDSGDLSGDIGGGSSPEPRDDTGDDGSTVATSSANSPVSIDIERITRCGTRCRRATATITNVGDERLENVTAETRIRADDRQIWSRTYRFGRLSADESVNRTARIAIGTRDVVRIAENDGWITIEMTVRWDGGSATFSERRQVLRR